MWIEKFRPRTLDDVAAHKEIIETSAFCRWTRKASLRLVLTPCSTANMLLFRGVHLTAVMLLAVKKLVSENRLPHLLFYGPPGTGKTSTILAVARQIYGSSMANMVLEMNASDDRGIGVVRQQVVDFASTRTIFRWTPSQLSCSHGPHLSGLINNGPAAWCSNKFKLVILDECDAMTKDAQFALRRGVNSLPP